MLRLLWQTSFKKIFAIFLHEMMGRFLDKCECQLNSRLFCNIYLGYHSKYITVWQNVAFEK